MKRPIRLLAFFTLAALPLVAVAQFVDPFDTIDAAWVVNRYPAAGFSSVVFDGDRRLQLTIAASGSTANRDYTFGSPFYNTQGAERPGGITGLWTLSAQVYVASAFTLTTAADPLVRGALWGHSGTTPDGGAYLIFGFTNASPTDLSNPAAPDRRFRFRAFDPNFGDFIDLGVPDGFVFDAWHTLAGTSTGTAFEYRIDGQLVLTNPIAGGEDLLSAMVQGYNFGQAGSYSVYWDDVTTSAIPEPGAGALGAALAALGLAIGRRLLSPRQGLLKGRPFSEVVSRNT